MTWEIFIAIIEGGIIGIVAGILIVAPFLFLLWLGFKVTEPR